MSAESIYLLQSARLPVNRWTTEAPSLSDTLQCRCTGAIKQASSPNPDPTSALNLDKALSDCTFVPLHYGSDNDSLFNADGGTKVESEKTAVLLFKLTGGALIRGEMCCKGEEESCTQWDRQ